VGGEKRWNTVSPGDAKFWMVEAFLAGNIIGLIIAVIVGIACVLSALKKQ
jgi:hypothetical protein